MTSAKPQWKKRVDIFRYIYSTNMFGQISGDEIKKNAFENHLFDVDQMKVIEYFADNYEEIVNAIKANLAEGWTLERIPQVDKAILMAALAEFKTLNVDRKIVIDQAIVTTKHFADPSATKYINAILDKIIK